MNMQEKYGDDIVVSICITAYNHGPYISQALDSVLAQETGFRYEIVVGEDCSTDDTREILLAYKEKYPDKIKLLLHDENMGGKKNVITTLKNCSGKYIAMLDGDDYWTDSKKLQIQIDLMEKNPNCHMSFHPAEARIDTAESGKVIARHSKTNEIFTINDVILGGGGFCPTASTVFRREAVMILTELRLFLDAPVGDYYMQIFGALHGGALYIDKIMSVYRQDVTVSWQSSMKNIDKRVEFYQKSIKTFDDLDIYLDHKYHNEIKQKKSKEHYYMAIFYLYNNRYKDFKKYIELSYSTYPLKSLYYLIDYHLSSFPRLIKNLKKLKQKYIA